MNRSKTRRTRDVAATFSLTLVDQIIFRNRLKVRIGKKSKGVTRLLTKVARLFRAIDADRDRTNSYLVELIQISLNTPQLGVA